MAGDETVIRMRVTVCEEDVKKCYSFRFLLKTELERDLLCNDIVGNQ